MASELENKVVSRSVSKLYLNNELSDVCFVFETKDDIVKVCAHKLILAAASPVFHKMFYGLMNEGRYVKITDATASGFKTFLQFFYLEKVILTMENMDEILSLANKYDMFDCANTCMKFIKNQLRPENVCWAYQLSIVLDNNDLKRFCEKVISIAPLDVFQTESFLQCDRIVLKHILRMDLMICKETELFDACLSWAMDHCKRKHLDETLVKNLKFQLDDCFSLIRFGSMTENEFIRIATVYRELFPPGEFLNISFSFGQAPRSNTLKHWNKNQEIMCWRECTTDATAYHIKNIESAWFTTNQPILLGTLWCKGLLHRYSNCFTINFKLNIIEIDSQTFDNKAQTRSLFTGSLTLIKKIKTRFPIPQPLVIYPEKMYEIRLEAENTAYYYHCALWNSDVSLDDELIITFHKNPKIKENDRCGLVSCLSFKNI